MFLVCCVCCLSSNDKALFSCNSGVCFHCNAGSKHVFRFCLRLFLLCFLVHVLEFGMFSVLSFVKGNAIDYLFVVDPVFCSSSSFVIFIGLSFPIKKQTPNPKMPKNAT